MIRVKNPNYVDRLPDEYQEVECLESTGTQYINTNYNPNSNTMVEISVSNCTNDGNLFGAYNGSWTTGFGVYENKVSAKNFYVHYYSNTQVVSTPPEQYTLKFGQGDLYINGSIAYDGNLKTFSVDYPMYLLAANNSGTLSPKICRLYFCKVYDNKVLIRNFIPCYRKSDNIPGLYDLVNNVFYTNAGTGTFLVGKDINKKDVNIKPTYQIRKMNNIIDYSNFSLSEVTFENDIFTHSASNVAMVSQTLPTPLLGHKYYGRCMQKTPSGYTFGDGRFEYYCADIAGTGLLTFGTMQDTGDEWRTLSSIQELTGEPEEGTWQLRSFSVSGSHEAYRKELMIIDLTAAFGVGKEPTKEWCDENIPFFIGEYIMPSNWESNGETINVPLKNRYVGGKLVYGEPLMNYEYGYFAVGTNGNIYSSENGETWTVLNSPANITYRGIAYGKNRIVIVGTAGQSYYSLDDGNTWTTMTGLDTTKNYYDVVYGKDRFVCTGENGAAYYSLDGETWIAMSGMYGVLYGDVIYEQGMFLAAGQRGAGRYSTDGETWQSTSGLDSSLFGAHIAYGDNRFLAVGYSTSSKLSTSFYSLDGINWKVIYGFTDDAIFNPLVAYGNGKFVAIKYTGDIYYLADGATSWIAGASLPNDSCCLELKYCNDRFIALSKEGVSYYSLDGINWTAMTGLASATYYGVCCGRKAVPKYSQLKNYTMLYDLGNECAEITGGWNGLSAYTNAKATKNSDHFYMHASTASFTTKNKVDLTNYIKVCALAKNGSFPSGGWVIQVADALVNSNGIGIDWTYGTLSEQFKQTGVHLAKLDVTSITSPQYCSVRVSDGQNKAYLSIYNIFIAKQDNWQELCTIAGLNASDYTDEATLCANNTAIATILASEEAVEYMIYQCTGSFMGAFVANSTCLTALNNSAYNTTIQANEHWNKFLSMVA